MTASLTRRRVLQCAAFAGAACAIPPALAQAGAGPTESAHDTPLAPLLAARLAQQGVGLAAARLRGEAVETAFAGRIAAAAEAPIDAGTRFEIGSLTKTFVALLLAQRVVAGELALDDPVQAALPDGLRLVDSRGEPLRWADLATHRSGLPRLPDNLAPADPKDPYDGYDEARLWAFLRGWRPTRPRNAAFEYSNLGFGLLGHALARHAGRPFEALLRERVLVPLGLPDMVLAWSGVAPGRLAQGHDAGKRPVPPWHFDVFAGAGALRATLPEMVRYAQAALGVVDTPLASALRLALTPRADGPSPAHRVGLGWIVGAVDGRPVAQHDGGTFGFASSLVLDPGRRRAGLVLANAMVPVGDLALHLLDASAPLRDLAAEARATQGEAVALPASDVAPLAGRYALTPQFAIVVRADGPRLFAQATGQGEFELFARAPRRFFARVTPLQISFEGEAGPPPALELLQGGQRLRFVRE
jgi:CubicO group peptidase (beta-lactamase class C family)